ncbi:MAG: nucleoside triphosphate pyrophosphohydrolase [Candidatus Latescibacteria bacterium]|nr:nucleoside triphosphate pyrophosphohydrolase [Candidatus Latescibacterota bacterium]
MSPRERSSFEELLELMARLRGEGGCPWDREQTHASLKPYLVEEVYEALEAIDRGDDAELRRELGDVLLQVVFHAQIASEEGRFSIEEVCRAIVDKLIRRHPHVFGETQVEGADQVLTNWERIKRVERREEDKPDSALEGVPRQLPALLRAQRIQHKAARVGFDWKQLGGPLDKVEEEWGELRQACQTGTPQELEEEFGDLLFALVNTSRFLKIDAEDALRRAVDKFERRFRAVEAAFRAQGRQLQESTLEEMDQVWNQVKEGEAGR